MFILLRINTSLLNLSNPYTYKPNVLSHSAFVFHRTFTGGASLRGSAIPLLPITQNLWKICQGFSFLVRFQVACCLYRNAKTTFACCHASLWFSCSVRTPGSGSAIDTRALSQWAKNRWTFCRTRPVTAFVIRTYLENFVFASSHGLRKTRHGDWNSRNICSRNFTPSALYFFFA